MSVSVSSAHSHVRMLLYKEKTAACSYTKNKIVASNQVVNHNGDSYSQLLNVQFNSSRFFSCSDLIIKGYLMFFSQIQYCTKYNIHSCFKACGRPHGRLIVQTIVPRLFHKR